MNSIDRDESWNSDNDFLSGVLRGAADEMPGGEVNDLHISFGVVRDRVRRRRAVKIGGLAGVSLVLVGGIAFGATKGPLLDGNGPVLPGSSQSAFMTPDKSQSDTSTLAPEASWAGPPATSVIQDGYQPDWLTWSDLQCGMPVADLESTAPGWSATSTGDIYGRTADLDGDPSTTWGMSALVEGGEGTLDAAPVLVWSQDGVVVDLGTNVLEAPGKQSEPLIGGGAGAVEAEGGAFTSCEPSEAETNDTFETPLPDGDYEVRVVAYPEIAAGQWATAVSEPVSVRIDADGAHTATGTRGGPATIEPPEPAEGELSRLVLDRSTDWVTAELTQRGYVTTGTPLVSAECESTDPADMVTYEVVQPSTNEALGSGEVLCDGSWYESLPVVGGGKEVVAIRLTSVPDGVARFWAAFGPTPDAGNAAAECSASNLGMEYDPANSPSPNSGAKAAAIVDAAVACDSERLIQLATDDSTELMFSVETPEQVFGLPENDALPYETLVRLLAGTRGQTSGGDAGNETVVWPRVATEEFADSDEAWDEVVTAGLATAEQAASWRADEVFGYQGMRIGIAEDGTWRYYSASD
ncbi:hypothetical protein [Promicromonospora soli]|uniref:Uncharacterized protein n=1 Tax=Promicromonospora soli TaxID=2035533 RepID=A0A919KQQ9_9MICO|nr:hypothetical protein [Promicromonospora soli]GHH69264.1 hypothetical protein GCM10017772_13950 [Promicromonospora soli]